MLTIRRSCLSQFIDPEWEAFQASHTNPAYATGYDVEYWKAFYRKHPELLAREGKHFADPEVEEAAQVVAGELELERSEDYERAYGARDREIAKREARKRKLEAFGTVAFITLIVSAAIYDFSQRAQKPHSTQTWFDHIAIAAYLLVALGLALRLGWVLLAKVVALFVVRVRNEVDAKRVKH